MWPFFNRNQQLCHNLVPVAQCHLSSFISTPVATLIVETVCETSLVTSATRTVKKKNFSGRSIDYHCGSLSVY